ncbi:MAG: 30S ribosomal protein S16 [Saprospiraceae bacterium]|nr:30S ribosomal protein S16 [Saprospiraceae bacterium]
MSVKIRLQRHGRKKAPFYHIVVADARSPRDGRFIEKLGTYNPLTKPATIDIDRDKAFDWIMKGAQPTDTVRAMLRLKGVMFKKHLARGVKKGAMTQEEADVKWQEWVNAKEAKLSARADATAKEIADFHATVAGSNYVPKKKEEAPVEAEEATVEAAAPAEEAVAEAPASEEAPAEETPAEEPAAEAEAPAEEAPAEDESKEEE